MQLEMEGEGKEDMRGDSGVTTDPADPAMRGGGPRPEGGPCATR